MDIKEYCNALERLVPDAEARSKVLGLTLGIIGKATNAAYAVVEQDCSACIASCLGIFKSKSEAMAYVQNCMEERCDQLAGQLICADFTKMEIRNANGKLMQSWSVSEQEVQ